MAKASLKVIYKSLRHVLGLIVVKPSIPIQDLLKRDWRAKLAGSGHKRQLFL